MSSKLNSLRGLLSGATSGGLWAALLAAGCTTTTPLLPGLSSFQITAADESNAIDTLPLNPVEVHLTMTAIDKSGNTDTTYNGFAKIFSVPGSVLTGFGSDGQFSSVSNLAGDPPVPYPTVQFVNGAATVDAWVTHAFGETVFVVQDVSGTDAGAGDDLGASGASNPIRYANLIIQDTQTTNVNIDSPFNGSLAIFDGNQVRCLAPPGDGGACPEGQSYQMQMIVSSVGSDFFTVLDLSAYNADSGVPTPGADPNTGVNDLPGSWASMYIYNFDAPNLVVGDRLVRLGGTLQEFAGDTQLNFPFWTVSPDSMYQVAQAQDLPPPVPINPNWCVPRDSGDQTSDYELCETSIDDVHLESLESALVSLSNATLPDRWISCDVSGTGKIDYRTTTGCMPQTQGDYCEGDAGGGAICLTGEDCIANECLVQCSVDSDCPSTGSGAEDIQECLDHHCQNACMCRQYCDSMPGCAELYEYDTYGQYTFTFPAADGGLWKFGAITKTGVPSFNPYTSPGMVVDFTNGILEQVDASDPPWLIVPRLPSDMCCHADSPGCGPDAGIQACPTPSSP